MRIYAIYDADGSLTGELAYMAGKLLGMRECALCDISHGLNPLGKSAWRQRRGLVATVIWQHRDEQLHEVAAFTAGKLPMVVAHTDSGITCLLSADELHSLNGDLERFTESLSEALARLRQSPDP